MDRRSGGRRRRYVLVILVLTALTLVTLDQRAKDSGPIGAAGRLAHRVVQPVANAMDSGFSPIRDWWNGWIHSGDRERQNRELRRELAQALAKQRDYDQALEELQQYKALYGQPWLEDYATVGAQIVTNSTDNFTSTVTINRGTEKGIAADMAVIAPDGLVGRVVRAWNGGATVRLITDQGFGVAIQMSRDGSAREFARTGANRRLVVTFGDNGQKVSERKVAVGDTAFTCGCLSSLFPPSLPVGRVSAATRSQDGSQVTVTLVPFVDLASLDLVKVVKWTPGQPVPPSVTATTLPRGTTTTVPGATTTTVAGTSTSTSGG